MVADEEKPARHFSHFFVELLAYVPGIQSVQKPLLEPLQPERSPAEQGPHLMQALAAEVLEYRPSAHGTQLVALVAVDMYPAGQSVQNVDFATPLYLPSGQAEHASKLSASL